MAARWPDASGDYAAFMNKLPKVVFSATLPGARWPGTRQEPRSDGQDSSASAASRSSEARRRSVVVARARGSRPSSVSRVQS